MSKNDLFNAVQRKYLKTENSLSPMGESEQNAPIFNRIQSKYLSGLDAPPERNAEDGAFNVLPPLSFLTGAHTGEESPGLGGGDRTTGSLAALGMTGESLPEPETMGFRLENAFAYTPYARVKDDGLPGLRTMEFWAPTISPEERAEHYSLLSEQQRISTPRLRLKSTDLDKKDPGVDKAKERKVPAAPEVGTVAPEPIKDETPRQQSGRYDDKTGKTWFDCGGKEVWADMETLQGVGVLPDGTFVNAAKGDRFAKPVYEVIYQRDSGQISKEEADQRLDAIAWEIAGSEYPNEEDLSLRNENYLETSERLKSRTIDYYSIPDITDQLNDVMENGAIDAKSYLDHTGQENGYLSSILGTFAKRFRSGDKYDLKQWPEYKQHSLFIYDGELVSRDALGNIFYGYVTEACELPEFMRKAGAGIQQIKDGSRLKWANNYFDDPRDTERINQGIALYRKSHDS